MNLSGACIEFLLICYFVSQFSSVQCVSGDAVSELNEFLKANRPNQSPYCPEKFECICGFAPYPVIFGSVSAAASKATDAAYQSLVCGNSSSGSGPASLYRIEDYQCYCGQRYDADNFKQLKLNIEASAAKYKAYKPATSYSAKLECFCGYLVFPQLYRSMEAAVAAATAGAKKSASDDAYPPKNPLGDYEYLKAHYNLTDYQCYCSLPYDLGDTSELQSLTYAAAIKYEVPQATKKPCAPCNRSDPYPSKFKCACGFPLFPKTYNTLANAVSQQTYASSRDLAKPNCPTGDLSTYKLTDNQCFCTQTWSGEYFKELNQETVASVTRYRVREALATSTC